MKFCGRFPKHLDKVMRWRCKLYGSYSYGHGICLYTVPASVAGGANLMCTSVYLALVDMVRSGRPLPLQLHLQLDNTTSENKCLTALRFAAWLVARGYVREVRIFFLYKGHTHTILDDNQESVWGRNWLGSPASLCGARRALGS